MDDAVRAWVETTVGGTVVKEERPTVGGSRDEVVFRYLLRRRARERQLGSELLDRSAR